MDQWWPGCQAGRDSHTGGHLQQWSWHSQPSPCWGSPGGAQHPPSLHADVLASQKSAARLLRLELSHPTTGGAFTPCWRLHLCSSGARSFPCALKLLLASVSLEGVTSRAWQPHHTSCPGLSRRKEEPCGVGWRGDREDTGRSILGAGVVRGLPGAVLAQSSRSGKGQGCWKGAEEWHEATARWAEQESVWVAGDGAEKGTGFGP